MTPSIHGAKDFLYPLPEDTIKPTYLYDLNYLQDTTKDLITANLDTLNKDNEKFIDLNQIYFSLFPQQINEYNTFNERLEIKEVLEGNYPTNETELLIPEVYAISIANELGVNTYAKLIGENISLLNSDYTIVGVYNGANQIIAYPPKEIVEYYGEELEQAIFIKFADNQQKKNFYDQFDNRDVVNSSDFYINNIKFYLPQVLQVIVLVVAIVFIIVEQKQYVSVLNHHRYSILNYLTPMVIPVIGLIVVSILI